MPYHVLLQREQEASADRSGSREITHTHPEFVLSVSKLTELPVEAGSLLLEVAADLGLEAGVGALVTCVRDIDTLAEAAKAGNFVSVIAKLVAYLRSLRQVQLKLRGFKVLWRKA